MTMRVLITNDDKSRTAHVKTLDLTAARSEGDGEVWTVSEVRDLAPEGSGEFWVHSGRKLQIEEAT